MQICVLIPMNFNAKKADLFDKCLLSISKQTVHVNVFISVHIKQLAEKPKFIEIYKKYRYIFDCSNKNIKYIESDYYLTTLEHLVVLYNNIQDLSSYTLIMFARYYDCYAASRMETHLKMFATSIVNGKAVDGNFEKCIVDNYDDIDYVYYSIVPAVFTCFCDALMHNVKMYNKFKKLKRSHMLLRFYLSRSKMKFSFYYSPEEDLKIEYLGVGSKIKDEAKLDSEKSMIKTVQKGDYKLTDPRLNAKLIKFVREKLTEAMILMLPKPFKELQNLLVCFTTEQLANVIPNYEELREYCSLVY